jgi:hypothetical protein
MATAASAQNYALDWFAISGAGDKSTGGVYSVSGTLGQTDAAGPMLGGSHALAGGFWSLISMVPMFGALVLTVVKTSTNAVKICWSDPSTGWVLQQNNDLNTTNWVTNALPVAIGGTHRYLTVSPPVGQLFFHLCKS